jgi:hypothetical protein
MEDLDLRPGSAASPPQRTMGGKRPHIAYSPFSSEGSGRWERDAPPKRVRPNPLEVLCKAFPGHGRDVLERIYRGCGGNVVQAIECVLENEGPAPLHAPIPIMPNPTLPPVIYSGYAPRGGMLQNTERFPPDTRMAVYHNNPPAPRARASPQALIPYAHAPANKSLAEEKQSAENGTKSKYEMKKVYCTNCGHKFQENDNFCGNCGQRLTL